MDSVGHQATWPEVLSHLLLREDLTPGQATWAMDQIMAGEATAAQIAGFATALRAKGENPEELDALVSAMLSHATLVDLPGRWIDTCGTGGDKSHTINISTAAAIVVAAAGYGVTKHGNRAATSQSGSADVLEALGVRISVTPERARAIAEEVGITFFFAPVYHPSMRHAAPVRKEMGIPTFFNVLGPLANPARPAVQIVGVADERMAPVVAAVLARRGVDAMVFRGEDGLDELTLSGSSTVWLISNGGVQEASLDPADLGLSYAPLAALRGSDAAQNAAVIKGVLAGEPGAHRDAIVLNAAAAIATFEQINGSLEERLSAGLAVASASIDSGAATATLERWSLASQQD
jgi:anthranilate phosphoribosyltransferase